MCSLSVYAQDDQTIGDNSIKSNEVKLNALFAVAGAFDITYERLLNEESGVGLDVFIPYDEDIKENINYYISPYYRLYFGNKYASGFFLEGFGMLNSTNHLKYVSIDGFDPLIQIFELTEESETNFALGIGVGGKWYTNNGFIGEISLGVGRNLLKSDYNEEIVAKLGITVGYRF